MKRIILSILVAAICTAGHAQSITGSWKGSPVKESQNGIESLNTTDHIFNPDGTFRESSKVSAEITFPVNKSDSLYIKFTTSVSVSGNYSLSGDKLQLKYNYKQAEGSLDSIEIRSNKPSVQEELDKKKSGIDKMVSGFMEKELKKAYKSVNGDKTIMKLTPDTLEYQNDEGVIYTFRRK